MFETEPVREHGLKHRWYRVWRGSSRRYGVNLLVFRVQPIWPGVFRRVQRKCFSSDRTEGYITGQSSPFKLKRANRPGVHLVANSFAAVHIVPAVFERNNFECGRAARLRTQNAEGA